MVRNLWYYARPHLKIKINPGRDSALAGLDAPRVDFDFEVGFGNILTRLMAIHEPKVTPPPWLSMNRQKKSNHNTRHGYP